MAVHRKEVASSNDHSWNIQSGERGRGFTSSGRGGPDIDNKKARQVNLGREKEGMHNPIISHSRFLKKRRSGERPKTTMI